MPGKRRNGRGKSKKYHPTKSITEMGLPSGRKEYVRLGQGTTLKNGRKAEKHEKYKKGEGVGDLNNT